MENTINYNFINLLEITLRIMRGRKATIHCRNRDNSCLWADEPKRMGSAGSGKQLFTASTAIIVAFGLMSLCG